MGKGPGDKFSERNPNSHGINTAICFAKWHKKELQFPKCQREMMQLLWCKGCAAVQAVGLDDCCMSLPSEPF